MSRTSLVLRSLFLLGFVLAMPLLAVPSVVRWADEFLYGEPSTTPAAPAEAREGELPADAQVVQAVLETPLTSSSPMPSGDGQGRGLDSVATQPPEMPPSPDFPASPFDSSPAVEPAGAAPGRLGEIRQRLEDLGAEYIRLEAATGTGEYHCQCRMLLAPGSAETETFEASGLEATSVAEQVLKAVEAWRSSRASLSPLE
jgi:hypothetical protein